ncbi:MAG: hypothetical protein V4760_04560 [Bdellovibrionota bacterium]
MPTLDARTARRLKIFILLAGLALRFVWVVGRGLSRDELTSFAYVFAPEWQSLFWDNAPPTFYALMKGLYALAGSEWVLRGFAFLASATSFILFFRFLDREESNLWLLGFWAVSPTSVVNASFRPTVLVELAGIVFFLTLRSSSLLRILAALGGLAATSYLAFLAPLVALSEIDWRDRRRLWLLGAGFLVAGVGVARINWNALNWLSAGDPWALGKSSFLMLSQLWGFSLPLFAAVTWVLVSHRKVPRSFIVIVGLILIGPFVTGHRFSSSRFLILFTPWVVMSIAAVLRLRRDIAAGALIVLIPAVTTTWFLSHEKSGWREAGSFAVWTGADAIFYTPTPMARLFSTRFEQGDVDLKTAIPRQLKAGGWVLRANPERDIGMNAFLKSGGAAGFAPAEIRIFGEGSLEPVRAVRVVPVPSN